MFNVDFGPLPELASLTRRPLARDTFHAVAAAAARCRAKPTVWGSRIKMCCLLRQCPASRPRYYERALHSHSEFILVSYSTRDARLRVHVTTDKFVGGNLNTAVPRADRELSRAEDG